MLGTGSDQVVDVLPQASCDLERSNSLVKKNIVATCPKNEPRLIEVDLARLDIAQIGIYLLTNAGHWYPSEYYIALNKCVGSGSTAIVQRRQRPYSTRHLVEVARIRVRIAEGHDVVESKPLEFGPMAQKQWQDCFMEWQGNVSVFYSFSDRRAKVRLKRSHHG